MTKTTPENLPEFVTRMISEKIIRNELKPGERILETKIAEEMNISRSPIREALRVLEKNRLVELIPRKGARVTEINAQHIEWFYDIYEALYGLVARRAVERANDSDISDMMRAVKAIESAAADRDVQSYYNAIFKFAGLAIKTARNPLLEQMVLELWPSNRRLEYASLQYRKEELASNVTFFQRLMTCAIEKDTNGAVLAVHDYADNEKNFALKIANGHKKTVDALD